MATKDPGARIIAITMVVILSASMGLFQIEPEEEIAAHIMQANLGRLIVNVTDDAYRAIENANVTILGNTSYWLTAADGSAIIDDLLEDNYTVSVTKLGYIGNIDIINVTANKTSYLTIMIDGGMVNGIIEAIVTQDPISNATVEIAGNSLFGLIQLPPELSLPSGYYIVKGIPTGNYTITISAVGFEPAQEYLNITASDSEWRNFLLRHTYGIITGFIKDEALLPVENAEVYVYVNKVKRSVMTDISGAYEMPDIPAGNYTVMASKTGYYDGINSSVIVVNGERTQNVNITITGMPGRLFGTVISESFLVPNATVEISLNLTATTSSQGTYVIDNIPAGTYTVIAKKEGYESNITAGVEIKRGEALELNFNLIAKPGLLRGVVRASETNSVLAGCEVTITGLSERKTFTNEQGQYEFGDLLPGNYTIVVKHRDFSPYVESDILVTAEDVTYKDVYLDLVKQSLGGFISGMDLAHSLMTLAFLFTIVILAVAVYLRLKGLQYPERPPAVFEEDSEAEEEEEEKVSKGA